MFSLAQHFYYKLVKVTFCYSFLSNDMFRLYKRVIFRLLLNLRLITNASHVFLPCTFQDLVGFTICLLKPTKLTSLQSTPLVDVMRPLLLGYSIAYFLFSWSCVILKPLKMHFLIICLCRIK